MRNGPSPVRAIVVGIAATLAVTALLSGSASAEPAPSTETYDVLVTCQAPLGPTCNPPYQVMVETGGVLEAEFTAGARHCTSITVTFIVDGVPMYTSDQLGPSESTGVIDLGPTSIGSHTLGVQATIGTEGRCAGPTLSAWSGTLNVTTSAVVAPPTNADQCRRGGWSTFVNPAFRNQGDCVSFVATGGRNQPAV